METTTVKTTKWAIDPSHSEIHFKVKHLMISTVTGTFKEFGAEADLDEEDLPNAQVQFWANTASIFTNDEKRDAHLRSADFFDSEQHPKLTFISTGISKAGANWELSGDLTMKGVTRPIVLAMEWNGIQKDPWGNKKGGLQLSGRIDRKEWGLNWNAALEAGGMLVSDEVRILCEIQLVEKV